MSTPDRPNILLIMTDQQRGDCLGVEGHPVLQTPNMDSIAHRGVRFTRAYSTCPSCIAARRSLLSGQFPRTHGMVGYRDGVGWDAPVTLPQALRDAGYQTAHVGRSMHQHPVRKRYGYETMSLHLDYLDWFAANGPKDTGGWFGSGTMHNDWTAHPWPHAEPLHFTNWTVSRALDFLRTRDPSCPFFLTVSFIAPHPPLQPPPFYMERYLRTGVPEPVVGDWAPTPDPYREGDSVAPMHLRLEGEAMRSCRAAYYGLINHVDDQIRRLLCPITGVRPMTGDNTIIVFTSDHGEMLGDHNHWRKQVPYEGSARIPMLFSAPPRFGLRRGATPDLPVCLEDVMPTVLDMAGVPIPQTVEGRSLLPLLRGETPAWRDYLPIEHAPSHQSMTDGREKYVWCVADGREQFFDLRQDPEERVNLAAAPAAAARVRRWRERLIGELKGRPEGFTDGERLIPGRPYAPALPIPCNRVMDDGRFGGA